MNTRALFALALASALAGCAYHGPVALDTDFSHGLRSVPADVVTIEVADASSADGQEIHFSVDIDRGYHGSYGAPIRKGTDGKFVVLVPKGAKLHVYGGLPANPLPQPFCGPIKIRRNDKAVAYQLATERSGPERQPVYQLNFHALVQNPYVTGEPSKLEVNLNKPDGDPVLIGHYEPSETTLCTYHIDQEG